MPKKYVLAMWWLALPALLLSPKLAMAQAGGSFDSVAVVFSGGVFLDARWLRPDGSDGRGRLDCTLGALNCGPMNLEACDESPRPISVELSRVATTSIPAGSEMWVWLANSSSCTGRLADIEQTRVVIEQEVLDFGDPLVDGSTLQVLQFPRDVPLSTFNTDNLWDREQACDGAGVTGREVYVCFGIDTGGPFSFVPDGSIDANEPRAWIRVEIDTVPPPPPSSVKAVGLDGAVRVQGEVDDAQDVYRWVGRIRPLVQLNGENVDPELTEDIPCADWDVSHEDIQEGVILATGEVSSTFNIPATNGIEYEVCVFVQDRAGNPSPDGPRDIAMPMDECDFIECYPGTLTTGFCGAVPAPVMGLWIFATLSAAFFARKRRKSCA